MVLLGSNNLHDLLADVGCEPSLLEEEAPRPRHEGLVLIAGDVSDGGNLWHWRRRRSLSRRRPEPAEPGLAGRSGQFRDGRRDRDRAGRGEEAIAGELGKGNEFGAGGEFPAGKDGKPRLLVSGRVGKVALEGGGQNVLLDVEGGEDAAFDEQLGGCEGTGVPGLDEGLGVDLQGRQVPEVIDAGHGEQRGGKALEELEGGKGVLARGRGQEEGEGAGGGVGGCGEEAEGPGLVDESGKEEVGAVAVVGNGRGQGAEATGAEPKAAGKGHGAPARGSTANIHAEQSRVGMGLSVERKVGAEGVCGAG